MAKKESNEIGKGRTGESALSLGGNGKKIRRVVQEAVLFIEPGVAAEVEDA